MVNQADLDYIELRRIQLLHITNYNSIEHCNTIPELPLPQAM